jgi:amino acid adenylation domain-containing protein
MKKDSRPKLIGLITDHSPDVLVGLFGILKSGNGFVPIPPSTPIERIRFIIADCQIEMLVTESNYLDKLLKLSKDSPSLKHIICVDTVEAKQTAQDGIKVYDCRDLVRPKPDEAKTAATPGESLYVIYTSGSTGKPKGVPITHRNLAPLMFWSEQYFKLGEHTRVLQNLSYSFDFGIFELLTTVLFGGTLYFVKQEDRGDLSRYADQIKKYEINTIHTTPSFIKGIIPAADRLASLEKIHLGGEELTRDLVDEIFQAVSGGCQIYNGYGPTEASVNCAIFEVGDDASANHQACATLPIGKATANNSLFVLDKNCQPVPIGVPGELHVGGIGLTGGYLNRPDLTAEKLIPHPFSKQAGDRLYQTGDRVRYLSDGNIMFIGRIDYQVKIRGFRIETGEIEAALRQHPEIVETIVMAREDAPASKYLVAYFTSDGEPPSVSQLRAFLKERLPEYMVPSAFVKLDAMPVTAGGKVDRRALPVPDVTRRDMEERYVAPRTPEEEMIASICAELLGLKSLGVHDDLFNLGCHSLMATRIIARLRETFQIELPLVSLFEKPSVAGLADEVDNALRSEQRLAILPIRPIPRDREFPLSFAQERLWFLCKLDPNNTSYYIPRALQISGPFDVDVLERTFTELVRQHEILRTTFPLVNGRPIQLIHPPKPFVVSRIDLREAPEEEKGARVEQIILEQGQRPFDLESDLMLRVAVLRLAELEYVMVLTEHHLVHDGWTQGVLVRDFLEVYAAFACGKASPLPEPALQYADFAYWQRNWLKGEVLETQLAYWVRQLAGAPSFLELPVDHARPPVQSFRGAEQTLIIDRELAELLRGVSRQQGVTLFMTMFAAFNTLLYRYTAREDILVGSGIANRRWSEIENLLGMIINTLVLRTDLSGNPSFRELVQRVRAVCLQAYAHQDLPFEKVVEELKPERSLSYNPIFQVMFSFMDAPTRELLLPGLTLEVINAHNRSAKFDLNIVVIPHTEQLIGQAAGTEPSEITVLWEYSTDIYDDPTIARMLCHFENLLRAVVANGAQPISELPLLTEAEHRQIMTEWNDPRTRYPQDNSLGQLFEIQVARANDAVAVVYHDLHLTFLGLNERANQLAHHLRFLGLGPERIVAICLDRSVDFIVAILAVLKAGGAYLPLDPAYPKDRLAFMVDDSQAAFLITDRLLLDRFDHLPAHLVCLDSDSETISRHSADNLNSGALTDNAAYIIYTSGSTGTPKGMVISHNNVARLFAATEGYFHFDDREVWTLFHSFAFDFSVWELWGALLYGGRLVVVPYLLSRRPDSFLELLCEHRVTILNQTPSAFAQLSQEALANLPGAGLALRAVIFGGEALEVESLQGWAHRFRDIEMVNMYGITETTVHVTHERLSYEEITQSRGSLIGRPIADLQVYLLDRHLAPVPIGVAGEIYVGGEGIGRGYLRRAGLTAERMLPDPFSERSGARLYRSGDLGRYKADGEIEYLGRSDQQVKVRGFRIEPAEIEAALMQHDAVSQAAVVVRQDPPADKRLVAYVVLKPPHDPSAGELRDYLKQKLPDYMIPAAFLRLQALPLTANGKLDRKALPAVDSATLPAAKRFQPPRTPAEVALAQIWADVLHLQEVGIDDNFFDLGGDSILSIKVLSLARERGLSFSLQQLFRHQRISELAQVLSQPEEPPQVDTPSEPFSLISPVDRARLREDIEEAYPLTRLQSGMIFHSIYNPESALYHNLLSLYLEAPFDREKLERAVEHLVSRHEVLRTSFDITSFNEPLQLVHRTATVSIVVDDLRGLSFEEQEKALDEWMAEAKGAKFNWDQAPLLRLHIHRRSELRFQFTQIEYHAILDGWSVALMLAELFRLYLSDEKAEQPKTQPGVAFKDYVAMERKAVESAEQREAWLEMLKGSAVMRLPRWRREGREANRKEVRQLEVDLRAKASQGLRQLARQAAVPIKSVLLAAHLRVMRLLGNQDDVLTGLVTNGRAEVNGGDRGLGLFLNTLPLRVRLGGGTWEELAREVFDKEREIMWMRRYPLQELQKMMGGEALFETVFNYVHFHVRENLEGVKNLRVMGVKTAAETNFTLMVHFSVDMHTGEIRLRLDYDGEELTEAQMGKVSGYYRSVLEEMGANPTGRYENFSALSEGERRQLVEEWNETRAEYEGEQSIHEMFEAQASRTPNRIAVVCGLQSLSYAELNRRANRLAYHLKGLGAGCEVQIGICVVPSVEMVIGLLGILKSGASYVPLDPSYPADRLRYMVEDAQVSILLTQQALAGHLGSDQAEVVYLDRLLEELGAGGDSNDANPRSQASASDLAYVIYTSGSTGRAKGVMGTHRASLNRFNWMWNTYPFLPDEVCCLKTSLSFVDSIWEIFGPLLKGVRLLVIPTAEAKDPERLVNLLSEERGSRLVLVPSLLRAILESCKDVGSRLRSLRYCVSSGEALSVELWEEFRKRLPEARLINLYGSSEVAADATYFENKGEVEIGRKYKSVPIGRAIANIRVYLLDERGALVPTGVAGEIHIGGEGLARGYLRDAGKTAERYVPDGLSGEAGARLYKSGDIGSYAEGGDLEYLGRSDHQVKVRGFRIEPAEIEAALTQHPDLDAAAVVARQDAPGEKRLVGYLVTRTGADISISELRSYLKAKLPEYMIPSAYVLMHELPLTANGKLDRRALPAPDSTRPSAGKVFQPPRTPQEVTLAEVWAEALHLDRVGIYDSFFELGGDSIISIKALTLARARGLNFSLQQLFQHQTVCELAKVISLHNDQPQYQAASEPFSLISPADRARLRGDVEDAYPLTRLQSGLLFHSLYNAEAGVYHNLLSLHIQAPFERMKLMGAVAMLLERHEILRTSFDMTSHSEPLQLVHRSASLRVEVDDLRGLTAQEQDEALKEWMKAAKGRRFDWDQAPLLHMHVHLRSDNTFQYTHIVHHAILDGWSVALMLAELFKLYLTGEVAGSSQSSTDVSYRDYIAMEREAIQSVEQRQAWLEKLSGSTVTRLPRQRQSDRPNDSRGIKQFEVGLTEEVGAELKNLARAAEVPLKSVLLAAHLRVLGLLSKQSDVLTGLVTNGRPEGSGGDRVLGLFLNTLPLRVRLAGGTWIELVKEVFNVEREVMPLRWYPMLEVQKLMDGPLFETVYNFVHFHVLDGLEEVKNLRILEVQTETDTNYTLMVQFSVERDSTAIRLRLDYDGGELTEAQMVEVSGYYRSVLEEMGANPTGRYENFSALSEGEGQESSVEINATQAAHHPAMSGQPVSAPPAANRDKSPGLFADEQRRPHRRLDLRADYVPPATAVEEVVAGIWTETLTVDRVGVHDNFFDLGGDSLLAVQIGSRVREALKIDMPLQSLFEAPTVRGFCDSIRKAAREQRAVMAPPITPVPREGRLPLSLTQQRIWFAEQLAPGSPLYNLTVAMHIEGPLDVQVLEQSIGEVIRRHEALRTKIIVSEDQPSQIVCDVQPFTFRLMDLGGMSPKERDAVVRRTLSEQAQQPFDLARGALFRIRLLRLSEQRHFIALSIHHIVSDRWSMGILFREVSALYEAYSSRRPSPLPELPIQYVDFAMWQRDRSHEEVLEKHLPYWQEHLGGPLQLLDLPTVRPRPAVPSYRGARVPMVICKSLAEELKHLARRNNVTLFMALLAAFKTLLCRYTGQEEILVGSPVANRNRLEVENLIGLFVNTLMLKTSLSGSPDFVEVLQREKEVVLGAFAHQDISFEKLAEALRPEHGLVSAPLLQVMFVLQNAPMPALTLANLTISPIQSEVATAEFDITLSLTETSEGLLGVLDYSTDLFDESIINRMAGHFQVLLDSVATRATQPISSLPLLSQAERNEILSDWNNTTARYEQGLCLHQLFEAQVERVPDAIAVVSEQQCLTYTELNHSANRLANHLRELGIGPDARVGVGVEPSLEMIIGLLGILKAGGAYVPLDPEYPKERLAFMMADAEVKGLLTQRRLRDVFPSDGMPVVYLDSENEILKQKSGLNLAAKVKAENLAYVIYTSGSTGQAKGVMVPHSGVVNTLSWRMMTYSLTGADRILQNIPFTFDPAVWQIFGALLSGASLILPRPGGHKEIGYLTKLMAEHAITITDFPPSVLKVLLTEQGLNECKNLRYIFCGGEALPVDVQDRFFAVLQAQLFNQYGPTETTIDATYWECQLNGGRRHVPIGRPIANTQIYLLDPHLEAVPVGISGELHIGGAGVSRGYLNMADLTAERFIPNPFAEQSGARLYKTGDLAHYLEAGDIEFLGRIDSQVKIRGARVEIGEVQAALNQYAGINDAIVVVREDGQGDKQLVAYVAADRQSPLSDFELRSYLRGRLPEFMLPSHFVFLEKLPYTSTGKIDRQALPAPPLTRADQQAPYVPPRTPIEERLIAIWEEILKVDRIGIQDNFFSAGGHSLMSMQLMAQVRKTFGVDLSLRNFFAWPTVEGLAMNVEEAILAKSSADSVDTLLDMLEGPQEDDLHP